MSAISTFDYGKLDKQKLTYYSGQFVRAMTDHCKTGLAAGKIIAEAHAIFNVDGRDGDFGRWVECELKISRQTAYNYMWSWERFGSCKSLLQLSAEAMYALSSPKVPEAAAKEAAKMADKGERIDKKVAKELINKFSDKPKPSRANGKPHSPVQTTAPAAPQIAPQTTAPEGDGPINDEPEDDLDFAGMVKRDNSAIESFCRQLVKFYEDNCPKLKSIDHMGRYDSALSHVRAACGTLRTCKYQDSPCPKCGGASCSSCEQESDFGAVTVLTYRQLAG